MSPLNVAAPLVPVVAVALLAVAPTGETVAVTVTPFWLTGLLFASCSWTTGCWANATPLCALLDGGVVSTTFVAAPAAMVKPLLLAPVGPVAAAVRV